ncbi:unnamed protein product [Gongylonema pulchrum]|uniref:FACT complex subunit n=1 Tax=Gongylonema pulchrum TaxID=637853 RepID=A0A183E386_9BILA|nr:unnamed protein product [Gongylonema pulchrum]
MVIVHVDEKDFGLSRETMLSTAKPLGGSIIADQFAQSPTLSKGVVSLMTGEVDEALSEEGEGNGESSEDKDGSGSSSSAVAEGGVKRKYEECDEAQSKKRLLEGENEGDKSSPSSSSPSPSNSAESKSSDEDDDMAAAVERQFFAL